MKYKIFILGPQGSGKGTQAELLSEKLNIPNISVGQLLRDEVVKKSKIGKEIEETMKKGELVPNGLVHTIVEKRVMQSDYKNGFIFDGFPRSLIQAKFFETIAKPTYVLEIWISDQEAVRRISQRRICEDCGEIYHLEYKPPKVVGVCDKCGGKLITREDDTLESIQHRLRIYHKETQEVLDYYKEKGLLIKINGEQSIEDVKKEVFKKLKI